MSPAWLADVKVERSMSIYHSGLNVVNNRTIRTKETVVRNCLGLLSFVKRLWLVSITLALVTTHTGSNDVRRRIMPSLAEWYYMVRSKTIDSEVFLTIKAKSFRCAQNIYPLLNYKGAGDIISLCPAALCVDLAISGVGHIEILHRDERNSKAVLA
jgi:hypothetical protein